MTYLLLHVRCASESGVSALADRPSCYPRMFPPRWGAADAACYPYKKGTASVAGSPAIPFRCLWRFEQRLLACQEDTLAVAGREATGISACFRLTLRVQPTKLRARAKFACRPMDNDPKAGMRHGADPASFFAGRIACAPTTSRQLGWSGSIAHIEESFAPETSCPDCTGRHRRGLPSPGAPPG